MPHRTTQRGGELSPPTRLGFLYPGLGVAEDDLSWLTAALAPDVPAEVVETPIDEDAHTVGSLRELGAPWRLAAGAAALRARQASVAIWACTSGSFVFGWDGARRQVAELEAAFGGRASSTSLAFVRALAVLGFQRVAIAATYPDEVTAHFVRLLTDAGVSVAAARSSGIPTAVDAGRVDPDAVLALVLGGDHPDAEVVLAPDTALHTVRLGERLEQAVGKPVLTANQVTVWEAFRLANLTASGPGLGTLFAEPPA